jgi:hypothetical protein
MKKPKMAFNENTNFKIKTIVIAKGKSIELDPEQIEHKRKKSGW